MSKPDPDFILTTHGDLVAVFPLTTKAKGFFEQIGVQLRPQHAIHLRPRDVEDFVADITSSGYTYFIAAPRPTRH